VCVSFSLSLSLNLPILQVLVLFRWCSLTGGWPKKCPTTFPVTRHVRWWQRDCLRDKKNKWRDEDRDWELVWGVAGCGSTVGLEVWRRRRLRGVRNYARVVWAIRHSQGDRTRSVETKNLYVGKHGHWQRPVIPIGLTEAHIPTALRNWMPLLSWLSHFGE